MALGDKVVVTCAVTGAVTTKKQCAAIPYSAVEIGEECRRAYEAGAKTVADEIRARGGRAVSLAGDVSDPEFALLAVATVTLALAVLAGLTAVADPKKPNTSCAVWQLDNCYSESQMDQFLEVGHQMLTDYLAHIAVSSGPTLIYVPEGRSVNSQCGWQ